LTEIPLGLNLLKIIKKRKILEEHKKKYPHLQTILDKIHKLSVLSNLYASMPGICWKQPNKKGCAYLGLVQHYKLKF
jgi:hypothetical protein